MSPPSWVPKTKKMNPPYRLNGKHPPINLQDLEEAPGARTIAVHLTAATGKILLERNIHDRKISEAAMQKYATGIKAGEWRLTLGGIGFGPDHHGILADGQHRLPTIIWAKLPSLP